MLRRNLKRFLQRGRKIQLAAQQIANEIVKDIILRFPVQREACVVCRGHAYVRLPRLSRNLSHHKLVLGLSESHILRLKRLILLVGLDRELIFTHDKALKLLVPNQRMISLASLESCTVVIA